MKSVYVSLCAVLFMLISTVVPSLAADQIKIATFNIQEIIEKSKSGSEAKKVMEAKKTELQPKFKGEQDALKAQADEIEKKGSAWSEEVKAGNLTPYQFG